MLKTLFKKDADLKEFDIFKLYVKNIYIELTNMDRGGFKERGERGERATSLFFFFFAITCFFAVTLKNYKLCFSKLS